MRSFKVGRASALIVVAVALLAACGGSSGTKTEPAAAGAFAARTAKSGPVDVSVTPKAIDGSGARFKITLDNHQVNLTGDYAKASSLTVDGKPWTAARWSGDGPTGHHREGTLSFAAAGPVTGSVELRIGGLPKPVTLTWDVKG